jgi:serpin B
VVEKARVAVDEQGTTAAAGGGLGMMMSAGRSVTARIAVDRPFMFVVRDTVSGQVLFLGQVTNPQG